MSERGQWPLSEAPAEARLRSIRTAGLYFPVLNARGGAERLTLVMALELAKLGIQTTIFTSRSAPVEQIEKDLGESIGSIAIATLPSPATVPKFLAIKQLRSIQVESAALRTQHLDLFINCDYRSSLPGCGRINVFYCHFPHDLRVSGAGAVKGAYLGVIEGAKRVFVDRNRSGAMGTYQQIWANSRYTARHVEQFWSRDAEVVYPPCDMLLPREKERLIVAVGRFQAGQGPGVPHKSQEYLIDAFRRMRDLHAEGWRLLLLGGASRDDDSFVASLQEQALGLPIEIMVNPERTELADVVGSASIFWHAQGVDGDAAMYPRSQEHFGISTVEAMSAGAIPLVFGKAGPAEIVQPVDLVEPWQTRDELINATRAVAAWAPEERARVAQLCVARAMEFNRASFGRRLSARLGCDESSQISAER